MNRRDIVITAGFEKPDIASSILRNPPSERIVRINKAVTSKLNFSVTNNIKAKKELQWQMHDINGIHCFLTIEKCV